MLPSVMDLTHCLELKFVSITGTPSKSHHCGARELTVEWSVMQCYTGEGVWDALCSSPASPQTDSTPP